MISDGEKWHYLAVKMLPGLIKGITSNHNGDFYCLNFFHSYSTKNKLKRHKWLCNDHDYCQIEMPNEDNKILEYKHWEKSLKALAIIYADSGCLSKKYIHVKIILKNFTQREKLSIRLLFIHCLQIVHLMQQKANLIITEGKTVWKGFAKI